LIVVASSLAPAYLCPFTERTLGSPVVVTIHWAKGWATEGVLRPSILWRRTCQKRKQWSGPRRTRPKGRRPPRKQVNSCARRWSTFGRASMERDPHSRRTLQSSAVGRESSAAKERHDLRSHSQGVERDLEKDLAVVPRMPEVAHVTSRISVQRFDAITLELEKR
jgi:hypothetical protein